MKNYRNILLLCLFGAFLYSCTGDKKAEKDQSFIELNVEDAINNSRVFDVTEKFPNTEFIPLETSDDVLVGEIMRIIKNGDYIYIYDDSSNILKFDSNGRFVGKIGGIGGGPDEYNMVFDFAIDKKNDFVIVNSLVQLVYFTSNGKSVKRLKTDVTDQVIETDGQGRTFYFLPDSPQPEDLNSTEIIKVVDTDGKLVKSFTNLNVRHKGLSIFGVLSKKNQTIMYKEEMGDVIYSINSDLEKDSIYGFNLGRYAFTEQDFDMQAMEKWNSLYRFDRLLISGDITFFNLQKGLMGKDIYPLMWDGKELIFPHATGDSSKKGLYFNGIKITPMAEDNDEIVCLASIVDILEQKEKGNLKIESLIGISEASNPVLCILK